jgi:SAM-dependent methyltransferase
MNWYDETIKVYDKAATELAEHFAGVGPRINDIEIALKLAKMPPNSAKVIEIGCGDGRDAKEISKRVAWYEGFDPSQKMLDIAVGRHIKNGSFVIGDAINYDYPKSLDVVYSFASLLHSNRQDLPVIFDKVAGALKTGGIFYISLKERDEYTEEIKNDDYGSRMFYYYNPDIIKQIAGNQFECLYEDKQKIGKTDWFTIALKKI